jgi:hypothetical protein
MFSHLYSSSPLRDPALFFFGDVLSVTVKPLTSRCTQRATYVPLRVDEYPTSLVPMSGIPTCMALDFCRHDIAGSTS